MIVHSNKDDVSIKIKGSVCNDTFCLPMHMLVPVKVNVKSEFIDDEVYKRVLNAIGKKGT